MIADWFDFDWRHSIQSIQAANQLLELNNAGIGKLAKKEIIEWLMKWLLELVGQALKDEWNWMECNGMKIEWKLAKQERMISEFHSV